MFQMVRYTIEEVIDSVNTNYFYRINGELLDVDETTGHEYTLASIALFSVDIEKAMLADCFSKSELVSLVLDRDADLYEYATLFCDEEPATIAPAMLKHLRYEDTISRLLIVNKIETEPEQRHQGHASTLLSDALERHEAGHSHTALIVNALDDNAMSNPQLIRWYESNGFTSVTPELDYPMMVRLTER